jgi:tRNA pseudouridine55 synthase
MTVRNRYNGILLVNKPIGLTSHDVIGRLRGVLAQKGGGHTGTLDPLAEGLMVVCLGNATKIAAYLTDSDKAYRAHIRLGQISRTYDAEGISEETPVAEIPALERKDIEGYLKEFTGAIDQTVPPFSAVQVDGKRLYKVARAGKEVPLPQRRVTIRSIEIRECDIPDLWLDIRCSKGTYIRSLAHDLGARIGCGAYLAGLTRTELGEFKLDDALTLEEIHQRHREGTLAREIKSLAEVLPWGAICVTEGFSPLVKHGRQVSGEHLHMIEGVFHAGDNVVLKDPKGNILAIGTATVDSRETNCASDQQLFSYIRVLN